MGQVFQTWTEADAEAKRVGGHVRCIHYDTRYEWTVKPGPDPRGEWYEEGRPAGAKTSQNKKGRKGGS